MDRPARLLPPGSPLPPLGPVNGRRELNKIDKLKRITEAARVVFETKDYDEATTREIARRAKVALGTIFTYADDKRDLLFLVINPDYDAIARRAAAAVRAEAPLLDNLLAAFRLLYEFFAESPQLSRVVLREMQFYETGQQASRFLATRNRMLATCIDIVRHAQKRKDILSTDKAELIGQVLFAIYQVEVRRWLASEPCDISRGLKNLEKALLLVIRGLSPRAAALQVTRRRSR
jgi:AcrR family transcriptional regulator